LVWGVKVPEPGEKEGLLTRPLTPCITSLPKEKLSL
jgi:hypothetical protein